MIKKLFYSFLLIVVFVLYSNNLDILNRKSFIDKKIQKEVEMDISKVLSRDLYAVFVNTIIEKKENQAVVTTESKEESTITTSDDEFGDDFNVLDDPNRGEDTFDGSPIENLPGFDYNPGLYSTKNEKTLKTKEKNLSDDDLYEIQSVEIKVIYDKNIPADTIQSLQDAMLNKVQIGYGVVGNVSFLPGTLKEEVQEEAVVDQTPPLPPAEETAFEKLADFILNNFWMILGILLLSILFFIILILVVVFFISRKKETVVQGTKEADFPPPPSKKDDYKLKKLSGHQSKVNLDEDHWRTVRMKKESDIVEQFSIDTLLGRKFFSSLPQEQKSEIMNAFSVSIRSLFSPFVAYTEVQTTEEMSMAEKYKKEAGVLDRFNNELNLFRQATNIHTKGEFGRMSFLDSFELKNILDKLNIDELLFIMDYLPRENVRKVLQSFPESKRKKLLGHDRKRLTKEKVENLSHKINREIDEIANSLLFPKTQKDEIYDIIFSESNNSKELFNSLEETDDKEKFKKYNITSDDFIAEKDVNIITNTFEDLENEEIALGLLSFGEEDRNKYKDMLNPARRQLIEDMMISYNPIDDRDKIQNGKFKIIDRYRQIKSVNG